MDLAKKNIENELLSIHPDELKYLYAKISENFNVIKALELENNNLKLQLGLLSHHQVITVDHQLNQ